MFFRSRRAKSPAPESAPPQQLPAQTPVSSQATAPANPLAPAANGSIAIGPHLSRKQVTVIGDIVCLLIHTRRQQGLTLVDIEALVLPAVSSGQFLLAHARPKQGGEVIPVAAVLWSTVSPEVDARVTADASSSIRLRPHEWKSGNIAWLVDAIGEPRAIGALLKQLRTDVLRGNAIKLRVRDAGGKPSVRTLQRTN